MDKELQEALDNLKPMLRVLKLSGKKNKDAARYFAAIEVLIRRAKVELKVSDEWDTALANAK